MPEPLYRPLEVEIAQMYSEWLSPYPNGQPRNSFRLECDEGWDGIIRKLLGDIRMLLRAVDPDCDFRILQIKEKFGGLRFYHSAAPSEVHSFVEEAEKASYATCEACGSTEDAKVRPSRHGWLKTVCPSCHAKRGKDTG